MAVITISRQYGSGGTEIAARVCELLGYRYLDKELIAGALAEVGLSQGEVVSFSEQTSKARKFLDRLLFPGPHIVAQVAVRQHSPGEEETIKIEQLDKAECLNLIRTAIHAEYRVGDAVIVGRGGQAVLQRLPGVFHVRVVAPMHDRILRLQRLNGLDMEQAYLAAVTEDRRAHDYLEEVFDIQWDEPTLYHLVINAGKMSVEQAAQLIAHAIGQMASEPRPDLLVA